jgi:hypothetical protein
VPLEGNHPEEEERIVLSMFQSFLKEREPFCGGDILDLSSTYYPQLRDTGFTRMLTLISYSMQHSGSSSVAS